MSVIGDRRRPGLPPELVARVGTIFVVVAVVELIAASLFLWLVPGIRAGIGFGLHSVGALAALLALLLLVGRIAYRVFDEEVAGLACLACAMAVPLIGALAPIAFDAHAFQAIALLAGLNGLMGRDARTGGWTIGLAIAAWLAISLDGALLALALLALPGLRWLRNRAERGWLIHALLAATVGVGAVLATQWTLGWTPACDALGPGHLAAFAWASAIAGLMAAIEPHPRAFTVGGFGAMLLGGAFLIGSFAPGCAAGAALGLVGSPSPWHSGMVYATQALGMPLLGSLAAFRLIGPAGDWLRRWWSDYTLLCIVATGLAAVDARAAAVACALAAVPVGSLMRDWTRASRNWRRPGKRALALTGFSLALAPALPLTLAAIAVPSSAAVLIR